MSTFPVSIAPRHISNARVVNSLRSGRIPYSFAAVLCYRRRLTIGDFTAAAATTQEIDLNANYPTTLFPAEVLRLPAAVYLHTPFTGGSVSACTVELGDSGDPNGLQTATSVFSGSGWLASTPAAAQHDFRAEIVRFAPTVTLNTTGGNVDDLTAGSLEVVIPYVMIPRTTSHVVKIGEAHRSNVKILNCLISGRIRDTMTGIFYYRQVVRIGDFTADADADQTIDLSTYDATNPFPTNVWRLPGAVYVRTPMSGGSVSAVTAELGDAGDTDELMTASSVFTGASGWVSTPAAAANDTRIETAYDPTLRLQTTGGTVDDLTAGEVEVVIPFIPLPNVAGGGSSSFARLFGVGANQQLLSALRNSRVPYSWAPMLWHRQTVEARDLTGSSPYAVDYETHRSGANSWPDNVLRCPACVLDVRTHFGAASTIDIGDTGDPNGLQAATTIAAAGHRAGLSAEGDNPRFEPALRPLMSITAGSIANDSELQAMIPFAPLPSM